MIEVYPLHRLYEEMAFVAYHFHWDREQLLAMPHWERQRWCEEISKINDELNQEASGSGGGITLQSPDSPF